MTDRPGNPSALVAYGYSERVLALFSDAQLSAGAPLEPARVVRVERTVCFAVGADGADQLLHASPLPAVGDWVAVSEGVVRAALARWSALTRADPSGQGEQVLAANVDLVFVTAPADRLHAARVERELALAWESGARPVVLVTKCDLAAPGAVSELSERLTGAEVAAVSVKDGSGLDELRAMLRPARTAVLIGPSGAGKSSLSNALIGRQLLATGDVRAGDSRGRHTTTSRQLVALEGGGVLIDTPGLRSLGLTGDVVLGEVFPDIEALALGCRFDDCRHEQEPGCAVTGAVASGELDSARLASFAKLERELAVEARRRDPLERKAAQRIWKARSKAARQHAKRRLH